MPFPINASLGVFFQSEFIRTYAIQIVGIKGANSDRDRNPYADLRSLQYNSPVT